MNLPRRIRSVLPVALVIGSLAVPACLARPLALDDMYRLQTVSDPQVSPDGAWVAYTVTNSVRDADKDHSDIWLASWDGKQNLQLTRNAASEHNARWSPDGRYLAFLSDRGDAKQGEQIWILDRAAGEARQLTHHDGEVSALDWSPDGSRIVFAAEVAPDKADADKPRPIVIDRLQFKQDAQGYLGRERSHLFLVNTGDGAATQLTDGSFNEIRPAWSPDGTRIAFFTKRGVDIDAHDNWDVYLVEPRAGAVPRQLTTNPGTDGDPSEEWSVAPPRFSPDGASVGYLHGGAPEDIWYGLLQVGVVASSGGAARLPTAGLDRNTLDPAWSPDGQWLYFRLEDDCSMLLARVRLRDGRVERLTAAGSVVSEFDLGRGGRIVAVYSTSDRPTELAAVEHGKLRALSHHNDSWVHEVQLARARDIQFRSADGLAIHGLLMTPAGDPPGTRRPAILRLHGGPSGQHQHEFDFTWQLLAANGYAVVAPNPRGSTGRGFRFGRLLFADWGYADVPDVLAAVDHAVAIGVADPERLGVGGWSYGAILTNYVIAADARFKAAISGAGIANMFAGYGDDHYVREWEIELGLPWANPQLWQRLSYPFFHAERISTPTLFMVGAEDFNVPPIGSEQMYQALRRLGVPTQLVIYPGQRHQFQRADFRADRLQRYLDWYDRYLK